MKSADANRAGTGHTEHFANLHGAGPDRAIAKCSNHFKVAGFDRAIGYNAVGFADVQGANADRAVPRYRDDLADGKIVWPHGAVVMQVWRLIKLNSCCLASVGSVSWLLELALPRRAIALPLPVPVLRVSIVLFLVYCC